MGKANKAVQHEGWIVVKREKIRREQEHQEDLVAQLRDRKMSRAALTAGIKAATGVSQRIQELDARINIGRNKALLLLS